VTPIRIAILVLCLFAAGCGYHVTGNVVDLPGGVSKVHIVLFANLTKEPYIDSVFTDSMSWRLLRHHNIELVEDADVADAVLGGVITQYHVAASAYDAQDTIQSYRVTMRVKAKLTRVEDGKILWHGDAIRYQDFVSSDVDISAQEGLEVAARKNVSDRLAEDLSWQMASGFGVE
jgi:outer membrane lipopolysaccharide assembly protein LptE/RlpB